MDDAQRVFKEKGDKQSRSRNIFLEAWFVVAELQKNLNFFKEKKLKLNLNHTGTSTGN
jgi:hypothetical protein